MHNDQIYIARDGKSGMHVLVRILAVDDIGVDYPPIDPDNFNKLMMARDVKSLVLAARNLGPMYISADILSRRTFIPSHLQQDIECGFNLIPPNLESLLSECYFDPYAIPDEIAGIGYRAIGRTGKKATRELINELDFTKAGDLSYLDSQFRAIVEPLHDWVFARNLLSILMRIGGLYRSGADPNTILEAARFRQVNPMVLKKRFDIDTDTCYAIPIAFNPIYRMENLADKDISFDALQFCPLYGSLIDKKNSFSRTAVENHLKGPGNEFVKFLAPLEASRVKNRLDNHESHSEENKWRYMVVSSNTDGEAINNQMQLANRLLQAFDGILFQPQLTYTGVKMAEIAPERKPRNILEAMWLLVRNHPGSSVLKFSPETYKSFIPGTGCMTKIEDVKTERDCGAMCPEGLIPDAVALLSHADTEIWVAIEFRVSHPKAIEDVRKYATVDFPVMEISITDDIANAEDTRKSLAERITGTGHVTRFAGREWLYSPAAKKILKRSWHIETEPSDKPLRHKGTDLVRLETPLPAIMIYAVKGAPTGETSWDNIDLTLREISEATVEKQKEALRKKRSLSSRCPSYKNSALAGRQIKQTEDTGFETSTKPHGILGRIKGLFDKFRK